MLEFMGVSIVWCFIIVTLFVGIFTMGDDKYLMKSIIIIAMAIFDTLWLTFVNVTIAALLFTLTGISIPAIAITWFSIIIAAIIYNKRDKKVTSDAIISGDYFKYSKRWKYGKIEEMSVDEAREFLMFVQQHTLKR